MALADNTAALQQLLAQVNALPSGGGSALLDALINRSITAISSTVTSIGANAFNGCVSLASADFPNVTSVGLNAFSGCVSLTTVNFPAMISIGSSAFQGCTSLASVDLPDAASISTVVFNGCTSLSALILRRTDAVCTLSNSNTLSGTKIAAGTGYIYVPDSLVDNYKSAANWSTYAAQIKPLSTYAG